MAKTPFTDFCEQILVVLYQDGHDSENFISLRSLQQKYGLDAPESWLSRAMNHLKAQRRVDGRELAGTPDSVVARITGSGMAFVEEKYGSKDGVGVVISPIGNDDPLLAFDLTTEETGLPIDSTSWTGISAQAITPTNAHQIRIALKEAVRLVEGNPDNMKTQQAITLLNAAETLSHAPEPPADIIWDLINRAGAICGIIGLFVTLFTLAH